MEDLNVVDVQITRLNWV